MWAKQEKWFEDAKNIRKNYLNQFDTNKYASNKCDDERIFLNFLEFT